LLARQRGEKIRILAPHVVGSGAIVGEQMSEIFHFFNTSVTSEQRARTFPISGVDFTVFVRSASHARAQLRRADRAGRHRTLCIHTPPGSTAVPAAIAARVDLSLARSGATFPISDIVELARWGHFERGNVPWETGQRI
jgi:hypothetical protein